MKKIQVVPYDPQWPQLFQQEADQITSGLQENASAVHHVGSTSVPGLAAKPKIDIIAVVKILNARLSSLKPLGIPIEGSTTFLSIML